MLLGCKYNLEDRELTVIFSNGKQYEYVGVDPGIYEELISAESAGRFFNSIKAGLMQKQLA
jgi:hypothetical protein